jgi:hypothetical protein
MCRMQVGLHELHLLCEPALDAAKDQLAQQLLPRAGWSCWLLQALRLMSAVEGRNWAAK